MLKINKSHHIYTTHFLNGGWKKLLTNHNHHVIIISRIKTVFGSFLYFVFSKRSLIKEYKLNGRMRKYLK